MDEKSTTEVLTVLLQDPKNNDHLNELKKRIGASDKTLDHAAHSIISALPGPPSFSKLSSWLGGSKTWANCINQQTCYPGEVRTPKTLSDIVQAVNDARRKKTTVRAVGSGHSFSDVAPVYKGGILLDPHGMNKVLEVDSTQLKPRKGAGVLFAVESGITIAHLNDTLDKHNLALANMGAYDGQTLAGAISTGTHGTGIGLGPIASSVRAVVLVADSGVVFQIEPSNGISDPDAFNSRVSNRTLKQDDDWFKTVLVSMGCTGIIYSYILEVVPAYYLIESRTLDSWQKVKSDLVFRQGAPLPKVLSDNRHYEVDINPYPVNGVHSCIVQTKNITNTHESSGVRGIANWIAGILAGCPLAESWLVWFLNLFPTTSPEIINNALNSLVDKDYIDKSYKILNIGAVDNIQALAMELSYPADENLVKAIDNLLAVYQDEANKMNWYMAGPIALRFVAASDAYLAPQQGRNTCMVELDMLVGIKTGDKLLKAITKRVQAGNPEVRVHWGLDLDTVGGEGLVERYKEFPKWLKVYSELNPTGLFNSPFTDRLGISSKA
jgi:hypothetical protein